MKKHAILFKHLGENAPTPRDPVAVVLDVQDDTARIVGENGPVEIDLTKKVYRCAYYDDNRLVDVLLYSVGEVELPDWMDPQEWIQNTTRWKYLWGYGVEKDWPQAWQRWLSVCGGPQRLAAIKLLRTKRFRSAFRKSLREQLEKWLTTMPEDRDYDSPFSRRQWECIVDNRTVLESKRIDAHLYAQR